MKDSYKNNEIILGDESKIKKTIVTLNQINWLDESISKQNLKCMAKIRSTQKESSGILNINSDLGEFVFDSEIQTTSPGQACVFYLKDQVLGGGWITKTS